LAEHNGPDAVHIAGSDTPEGRAEPHSGAVFISYASQDAFAAERIASALRAGEIEVWFDQSELRGGDAWDTSIRRQIKSCSLFIPVISKNTHARGEGYFRLEWKLAVDRSHLMASDLPFLLPVVVDETPDQEDRVPDRFREVQWTRLPDGVTPAVFVGRVRLLLSGEASQGPTRTGSEAAAVFAAPTSQRHILASWRSRAALLVTIPVVIAVLGYLVTNRLVISKPTATLGVPPGSAAQDAPVTAFNPPPHSIAVLSFVNMSGDVKQDYFSDGISEELLNALSRLNELQVVARTSSFSFKGKDVDVSTIARKLNVGAVLEGSVRRAGNTVRITVQLINAVSGFHVWSQTYDRNLTDILKLQSEVAIAIAQQLALKLIGDEATNLEIGGTKSPEAYDAYLRGKQLILRPDRTETDDQATVAAFDQAIAFDPGYALAYGGRAAALGNFAAFNAKPSERVHLREQARKAAERAVALAPDLGATHLVLAQLRANLFFDFGGAATEFDRALALAPGNAKVLTAFGSFSSLLGRYEPAVKAARRSVVLDPLNVGARITLAQIHLEGHHYGEALAALQEAQALYPGSHFVQTLILEATLASGQAEQARQQCESPSTPIDEDYRHHCLALVYHILGRQADAEVELAQDQALDGDGSAYGYAEIYAQWGNKAKALQWLTTAEQLHDPGLQMLKVNWYFDPIRGEPQFKAIEARMNFPP